MGNMDLISDIALALQRNPGGWGTVLAVLYLAGVILYRYLRERLPNPGGASIVLFGLLATVTGFYVAGLLIEPPEFAEEENREGSLIEFAPEAYAGLETLEVDPAESSRIAAEYIAALADDPLKVWLSTYGPDQKVIAELLTRETESAAALIARVEAREIGLARIRLTRQYNPTKTNSHLPDLIEIEVMPGTWRAFEIDTGLGATVEIAVESEDTLAIKADPRDPSGALLTLCADNPRSSGCTRRINLPLIPPGEELAIPLRTIR